jgi:demethylmenaquinone methyltransferase/2-methoxy-6-polyprenyl-1,4-benzoquinol methylase
MIGRLVSKHASAYTYLPESIDQFASPEAFSALLQEVGFDHIERKSQSMGVAHIYIAHKS